MKSESLSQARPVVSASLVAQFIPGVAFALGLYLLRDQVRYHWLHDWRQYPWEFWVIAAFGTAPTCAGFADWRYHRSGNTAIGRKEHHSELLALACGGVPLFLLMATASVIQHPQWLLVPI